MALETTLQLLSEHMVFAVLEREPLRMLAFAAEQREYAPGAILFDQGAPAEAAYLLIEGRLVLTSERENHGEQRRIIEAGALLAESALVSQAKHAATAEAINAIVALRIPRAAYRRMLEEFPKSAVELRRRMAERLRALNADLETVRSSLEGGQP